MKLLTMEYEPTAGEITFFDTPLTQIPRNKVYQHRRQIGVVFQDYKLLPEYNVWENIALPLFISGKPLPEIESRVTDLLKLVNITDKAYLFPNQLSGGEAQRVSIARALATGPSVIFADEPTGNLDPETSLGIARLLKTINDLGTTVLFATHDLGVLGALEGERHIELTKGVLTKDNKPTAQKSKSKKSPTSPPAAAPAVEVAHEEVLTITADTSAPEPTTTNKKARFQLKLPSWPFKKSASSTPPAAVVTMVVEDLDVDEPVDAHAKSDKSKAKAKKDKDKNQISKK
jgi:cell division transport system ATP-binding protein